MIGAIAGDIIGSIHEHGPPVPKSVALFVPGSRFTDDTVLTIATAHALRIGQPFDVAYRSWGRRYPDAGYGGMFGRWLQHDNAGPYNSFGNGSAMRVSPVGWAFETLDEVIDVAARSAAVTHDHPEGIRGAQAIASAVWAARNGHGKAGIARLLSVRFDYALDSSLAQLQQCGGFDVTCQGTVPAAAIAFLESTDYEDAVRNALSMGGDTDTLACICGAIAEAHYGAVPAPIQHGVFGRLDDALGAEVVHFSRAHGVPLHVPPPAGA